MRARGPRLAAKKKALASDEIMPRATRRGIPADIFSAPVYCSDALSLVGRGWKGAAQLFWRAVKFVFRCGPGNQPASIKKRWGSFRFWAEPITWSVPPPTLPP